MKKILLGLLALSAVSMAATGDSAINVRFGFDIGAKHSKLTEDGITVLSDESDGFGGEIALEYNYYISNNFSLGLGIAYQKHADRKDATYTDEDYIDDVYTTNGAVYDSVPLYLTAKYKFITDKGINPYLKVNLGYSFNMNTSDFKESERFLSSGGNFETESYTSKIETDNGVYWAMGGGVEYNNFTVDVMYAITKAKSYEKDDSSDKIHNDYGRVVLTAGYKFDL